MALPDRVGQLKGAAVDAFLGDLVKLEVRDLRAILTEVFLHQGYEGDRVISIFNQTGLALSLVYASANNKTNPDAVRELRREASLTEQDVTRLRGLLDIALGTPAAHLTSFFHFSSRPVTGWWRYRDQFQLLPPPTNAPVPETVVGDWPFVVEARYTSPDHFGIKWQRHMQVRSHLRLLLPVLLIGPRFQPNTERPTNHWVIPPVSRAAPQPAESKSLHRILTKLRLRQQPTPPALFRLADVVYAQEFYDVEGRVPGGPGLTDVDQAHAMAVVDDTDAYYRTSGIASGDVLQVPAVLPELFDSYFALDAATARRYRRACYWFNLGYFFHGYSVSSSFFARVAAIESLLPNGDNPHPCAECGAPHYPSIGKAFRGFLETYVPDRPERETFYDLRSKIAHGAKLFDFDLREEFGAFYPGDLDQREQLDSLHRVCRIALVNWLLTQRTTLS